MEAAGVPHAASIMLMLLFQRGVRLCVRIRQEGNLPLMQCSGGAPMNAAKREDMVLPSQNLEPSECM